MAFVLEEHSTAQISQKKGKTDQKGVPGGDCFCQIPGPSLTQEVYGRSTIHTLTQ